MCSIPDTMSQYRSSPSKEADIIQSLVSNTAMLVICEVWPVKGSSMSCPEDVLQIQMVLSSDPKTRMCSLLVNSRQETGRVCLRRKGVSAAPVFALHTAALLSPEPLARYRPLGENWRQMMGALWPVRCCPMYFPELLRHSLILQSLLPEATVSLSGDIARHVTSDE